MKAIEVRVGNYAKVDNPKSWSDLKDKTMIVCCIEQFRKNEDAIIGLNYLNESFNITFPMVSQYDKYIKPIPLTEEWLVKLGFEVNKCLGREYYWIDLTKDQSTYIYYHFKDGVCVGNGISVSGSEEYERTYFVDLQYVHQLQNLYFALKANELILK